MIYLWGSGMVSCLARYPATARGNHFRPSACLHNLDMSNFAEALVYLYKNKKMAETDLADLIIPEIPWHWVAPIYLLLEVFIFGRVPEWFPANSIVQTSRVRKCLRDRGFYNVFFFHCRILARSPQEGSF